MPSDKKLTNMPSSSSMPTFSSVNLFTEATLLERDIHTQELLAELGKVVEGNHDKSIDVLSFKLNHRHSAMALYVEVYGGYEEFDFDEVQTTRNLEAFHAFKECDYDRFLELVDAKLKCDWMDNPTSLDDGRAPYSRSDLLPVWDACNYVSVRFSLNRVTRRDLAERLVEYVLNSLPEEYTSDESRKFSVKDAYRGCILRAMCHAWRWAGVDYQFECAFRGEYVPDQAKPWIPVNMGTIGVPVYPMIPGDPGFGNLE